MKEIEFKERQRNEAVARMKILDLHENAIEDFLHGVLNCSEYGGILYWLDEEKQSFVKAFEERTGAMVYHMIESHTGFGVLLTMLYVTKYEEEWERDQQQMADDGYICAYVENITDPFLSEIGGVMVKPLNGGVIRVA